MPRPTAPRLLLVALLLLLPTRTGWAEPIRWDYATFVFPGFVTPGPVPPAPGPPFWTGGFGVAFQGTAGERAGSSPITFADWWASGWLPPGDEATFSQQPIQLGIGILDRSSNRSETA